MPADGPGYKGFFREAIGRALQEEMERNDQLTLLGQDIGAYGGPYGEFAGLFDRFGAKRVRDTPVAEAAMIGMAVGAAAAGVRTLVSITYMDFLMLGLDPLVNYAAKLHYKTGGQLRAPVVVKTTAGAKGQGVAHSQCLEAWLMNVPGLTVVAPSSAGDAYGLLKTALRSEDPVVFVDHKRLFPVTGLLPDREVLIPFGLANVVREGADITIVSHSEMVGRCVAAADLLKADALSCEVIDLRCLSPLDVTTLSASVRKTGALLTVEEGQLACGVGAEVAFRVREQVSVDRVGRVGALPTPVSSSPLLEAASIPDRHRIAAAVIALLRSAG